MTHERAPEPRREPPPDLGERLVGANLSPSTRSATFSIDTNTMPIIVMWIVCSSGVSHSVDWIATLKGVA